MIIGYDHVQLAIPVASEPAARAFYRDVLGMDELAKPPALAVRGGLWLQAGDAVLHLGVEEPFRPARKAHPAFLVDDLDALRRTLVRAGYECVDSSNEIPGVRRLHVHDPFGNRLEFQQRVNPRRDQEGAGVASAATTPS